MVWDLLVIAGCVLQIIGGIILFRNAPVRVRGLSGLIIPRTDSSNLDQEEAAVIAAQRLWGGLASALVITGAIIQLASYGARWMKGY